VKKPVFVEPVIQSKLLVTVAADASGDADSEAVNIEITAIKRTNFCINPSLKSFQRLISPNVYGWADTSKYKGMSKRYLLRVRGNPTS
jgi:hypothetical protein